jgi:periplasmic protein TonB
MSTSQFCIQQRQQEQQRVRKLLWLGLASSIALHGILAVALPRQLANKAPQVKKPMELILVDKPKPKPKPKETAIVPKPKPEPPQQKAPEPKPEPPKPPEPKPEPPQQKSPEPKSEPPKPPEPQAKPKPEVSQPKAPTPKKILTSNLPPIPKAPTVPQPESESAIAPAPVKNSPNVKESSSNVATNSPLATSESESTESTGDEPGIACVSNCEPEYPDALEGAEGSAGVKLTIDPQGNVIGAELASADSNSQVNREALLAARQMEFSSPPGGNTASVQVEINFTLEGSDYDRLAREQERKEQAAKEQQEQEAARQQQQQQQKREQARIRQQQQEQAQPKPQLPDNQAAPKPLPALMETEADQEQLQKFRKRIENYQEK